MKYQKNILIAISLFVLGFVTSCGTKTSKSLTTAPEKTEKDVIVGETQQFDFGRIENQTYINDYFGLQIPYDENWFVQDQEQMKHLVKIGQEMVAGDDETFKSMIKASEVNSAYLFTIFQYEVGTPVDFNPSFMTIVENVSFAPGIKKGSDYLYNVKRMLEYSQMEYTFEDEIYEEKVDDVVFDVMVAKTQAGGVEISQKYYSTLRKGFVLSFISSFSTKEQKSELDAMIKEIKIK